MRKLLRSNFCRMWKAKIFWLGMALTSGYGLLIIVSRYQAAVEFGIPFGETFKECVYSHASIAGIVAAVFVSLFLGTEYSDGTIRNKLIIGHRRTDIYLSDFISCSAAVILQMTAASAVTLASGFLLFGKLEIGAVRYMQDYVTVLFFCVSYTAVFCFVSMLVSSKAHAAVVNILLAFAFMMAASYLYSQLAQPEMITEYSYFSYEENGMVFSEGEKPQAASMPNPYYVSGVKRHIFEFLFDYLPGCQMMKINGDQDLPADRLLWMCVYSMINTILFCAPGIMLFRNKDIK